LKAYLDTSVLMSLFVTDAHTSLALAFIDRSPDGLTSLWALVEFSSALRLRQRIGQLSPDEVGRIESTMDRWVSRGPEPAAPLAEDHLAARRMLRSVNAPLRAADALHLAVSRRLETTLVTFDRKLLAAAEELGEASLGLLP
jgi:predicted nucleic acid-binding protein